MKFLKIFAAMFVAGAVTFAVSSCSDDDDPIKNDDFTSSTDPESGGSTSSGDSYDHYDEVEILVSVKNITFNSTGGKWKISISATSSWSATGPDWVTIDPSSGTTYGDLTITASDNSGEDCVSRTGTITFSLDSGEDSAVVTVKQNGYGEDTEDTGGSSGGASGDFGGDEPLPDGVFYLDDFEWVRPYAEAVNQEDIVASNQFGTFATYTTTSVYVNGVSCQDELVGRGYRVTGYDGNELYNIVVMPAYLLFYCNSGNLQALHLPKLTTVPEEGESVWMELIWCPSTNGSLKPDTVTLTVEITTGDTTVKFDSEASTAGTASLYWSHHVFEVTGVTITEDTDIVIRPIDSQWVANSTTNRRYLVGGVTIYNPEIYSLN